MRVVAAFLTFLVVNLLTTLFYKPSASDQPLPRFSRLPLQTDILFLGSSVIAIPIHLLEQETGSPPQDGIPVEVRYVESQLSRTKSQKSSVWSLAAPGQMFDESFSVFSHMLETGKSPNYLVLCIAPVALLESTKTETGFASASSQTQSRTHSILHRVKNELHSLVMLYSERRQAQKTAIRELGRIYDELGLTEPQNMRWQRSVNEYVGRYLNCQLSQRKFDLLQQIAKSCQQNSTHLIIVSTPLHKDNRALMQFPYEAYSSKLRSVAFGCEILDLGEEEAFSYQDYYDSAHLNARGGKKLLNMILAQVNSKIEFAKTIPGEI